MVLIAQKRNYLERLSTKDGVTSAGLLTNVALKRLMAKYQDTEPNSTNGRIKSPWCTWQNIFILCYWTQNVAPKAWTKMLVSYLPMKNRLRYIKHQALAVLNLGQQNASKQIKAQMLWNSCSGHDGHKAANSTKKNSFYIERICLPNALKIFLSFFIEILAYDEGIRRCNPAEYAKVKPVRWLRLWKSFQILVSISMSFESEFQLLWTVICEGEAVYSREEAAASANKKKQPTLHIYLSRCICKTLSKKPWNLLMHLVQLQRRFCGRATWAGSVEATSKMEKQLLRMASYRRASKILKNWTQSW